MFEWMPRYLAACFTFVWPRHSVLTNTKLTFGRQRHSIWTSTQFSIHHLRRLSDRILIELVPYGVNSSIWDLPIFTEDLSTGGRSSFCRRDNLDNRWLVKAKVEFGIVSIILGVVPGQTFICFIER